MAAQPRPPVFELHIRPMFRLLEIADCAVVDGGGRGQAHAGQLFRCGEVAPRAEVVSVNARGLASGVLAGWRASRV